MKHDNDKNVQRVFKKHGQGLKKIFAKRAGLDKSMSMMEYSKLLRDTKTIDGKSFAFRKETNAVYDLDSYMQALKIPGVNPIKIGTLEFEGKKARLNRMAI